MKSRSIFKVYCTMLVGDLKESNMSPQRRAKRGMAAPLQIAKKVPAAIRIMSLLSANRKSEKKPTVSGTTSPSEDLELSSPGATRTLEELLFPFYSLIIVL